MAGATNPGNVGHAWVKALWVDHVPPPGFERTDLYDRATTNSFRARIDDNPIYAHDAEYRRTLEALPEHLRRAFLEGDWNVFAGQYFDVFEIGRHTARPEKLRLEPWWPRWISIDWGFQHPSAVYWHCAVPVDSRQFKVEGKEGTIRKIPLSTFNLQLSTHGSSPTANSCRTIFSPRMLAQAIAGNAAAASASAKCFLSPDAFAHRTSEASIAEQLGDVLAANGLPRPAPADNDRIGGWQLMYQMPRIGCLVHHRQLRAADRMYSAVGARRPPPGRHSQSRRRRSRRFRALWIGLRRKARRCWAGLWCRPGRGRPRPPYQPVNTPHFVTGMPLGEQIARQVTATDQTSRAIHYQRLEAEAKKQFRPKKLPRRPQVAPEDSGCVRVIAAANRSGHLTHPIGRQGAWEPFNELRFWQGS